jgi:hypothetical protein
MMSTKQKVVIYAEHPVIGRVYWDYTYEGDVNMPDYFGLATDISSAIVLEADWRDYQTRITEEFIDHVDFDSSSFKQRVIGNSGVSCNDFIAWAYRTEWKNLCVDGIAEAARIVYD